MPRLRDVVAPQLRALFVGINPGLRSWELGHNFAGRGNPFWRLLHAAGLIDRPIEFTEERRLLDCGFGITNVCARPTRSAGELSRAELAAGARALERRVRRLRPAVVVFVGLTIYQQIFGRLATPGAGAKPERFGGARVFVVPNPSGLNASFPGFAHKLVWFEALRDYLGAPDTPPPRRERKRAAAAPKPAPRRRPR
jgi:TDG/mug DNA glycosylase family protein